MLSGPWLNPKPQTGMRQVFVDVVDAQLAQSVIQAGIETQLFKGP